MTRLPNKEIKMRYPALTPPRGLIPCDQRMPDQPYVFVRFQGIAPFTGPTLTVLRLESVTITMTRPLTRFRPVLTKADGSYKTRPGHIRFPT